MSEPKTISFVATAELERLVKQWARDEQGSISATLRRILAQEAARRQAQQQQQRQPAAN